MAIMRTMYRLLSLLLGMLVLAACSREAPLSPEEFTTEYAAEMRKAFPALTIVVKGEKELSVTDAAGHERQSFLDNCYREYLADPKAKTAVMQRFIGSFGEIDMQKEAINPARITPIIKDRAWMEEIRAAYTPDGSNLKPQFVYDDFNAELVVVYAEDSPKNLSYLTPKQIEEAKIKKEDLRSLAVRNLRSLLPKMEIRGNDGRYMVIAGGTYEASLLLFDELWTGTKMAVDGEVVVAIPSRDMLLVTGSKNAAGLATLRGIAEKIVAEGSYRLTTDLFVYRNGHFERFVP